MGKIVTIDHNGKVYSGEIAVIKSSSLGIEDHGILTAMIDCRWDGGGIGVGGYRLDKGGCAPDYKSEGSAYGLDQIMQIMDVVGVNKWEALKDKQVIVLFDKSSGWGSPAVGIANLLNDKVLIFEDHAQTWRDREVK